MIPRIIDDQNGIAFWEKRHYPEVQNWRQTMDELILKDDLENVEELETKAVPSDMMSMLD